LLYRIAPDVSGKPLAEDEAVAGLIAMRPLTEVLETVMADRGGAPLHFVFAHVVFWIDTSAEALRWLSVVAAVAAIPVCFDLGRRLGGTAAGIVAAAVAASSTALAVYGSFGRMYALFVLAAALAADLFVRALHRPAGRTLAAAAITTWLLPAVHPYGAIPAAATLVVGLLRWRRRAWPFAVAAVAALPFLVADLRLADRAQVGGGESLASPGAASRELTAAFSAFAGGDGVPLAFFALLGLVGTGLLARREPAVAVLTVTAALPPVLFLLLRAGSEPDLSPRHLFYGLPLWAAAIGVAAVTLSKRAPPVAILVALAAAVSPASSLEDPRELGLLPTATPDLAVAERGDLLVPYAIPFLADLGRVREGLAIPQGPGDEIRATLEHAEEPIGTVFLARPVPGEWRLEELRGPFDRREALASALDAYASRRASSEYDWWYALVTRGLRDALRSYTAAPWQVSESDSRSPSARGEVPPMRGVSGAQG
jgi:hypothetical protein